METSTFYLDDIKIILNRKPSAKSKSGYIYSGFYHIADHCFPILSISHLLTLLFSFNLEQ
ncbi:MAG: hypothetical protein [Arizlama microvirus]|nr:MAG: hypothetical protein [Arizlama microvirus]